MPEIIPKIVLRINDDLNGCWNCPGCGTANEVFTIGATTKIEAARELKNVENVSCFDCARKFEVA